MSRNIPDDITNLEALLRRIELRLEKMNADKASDYSQSLLYFMTEMLMELDNRYPNVLDNSSGLKIV
jgi:hypothetical protein